MRENYFKTTYILILFWVFVFFGTANAVVPTLDTTDVPEYDYSQTALMIFYGQDAYVALANPFEQPAPVMGALVYEIILLYATDLQAYPGLPEEPTHVIDLLMNDINGTVRLGQRLFVGDPWLSDGKSLVLMKPKDYELLANFLRERYEGFENYDVGWLKNLRRPNKSELPNDWQPEKPSLQTAIERMVSDFERDGYDPGARIRRQWSDDDVSREVTSGKDIQLNSEAPATSILFEHQNKDPKVTLSAGDTTEPANDATAIIPHSQTSDETTTGEGAANYNKTQDFARLLPVLLVLFSLLLLIFIFRKKERLPLRTDRSSE